MMFGLGAGEGKGSGADWSGLRGAGVGLTRIEGVGTLRVGPWIEAGGSGYSSGVPSSGPWFEGKVFGCFKLGVKAEC